MADHSATLDQLLAASARLEGHRRALHTARRQLHGRAVEQLDSGRRAVTTATEAMDRGSEAGALGARYIRARHHEQARLRAVVAEHAEQEE